MTEVKKEVELEIVHVLFIDIAILDRGSPIRQTLTLKNS